MNIEELKRLAEAANKGFSGLPWQVIMERNNHGSTHYRVRGHCEASIAVEPDQYWEEDYDPPTDEYGYFQPDDRMDCDLVRVDIARHIAAANPAAVLELIRQRDELLAALEEIRTLGHNYTQVSHRVWKVAVRMQDVRTGKIKPPAQPEYDLADAQDCDEINRMTRMIVGDPKMKNPNCPMEPIAKCMAGFCVNEAAGRERCSGEDRLEGGK